MSESFMYKTRLLKYGKTRPWQILISEEMTEILSDVYI